MDKDINKMNNKFKCNNCGNQFISDTILEKCLLCNSLVTKIDSDNNYNTFYLKPFIKTKEDVIKDYKKCVFFNPLIPLKFKSKKVSSLVNKIYLISSVNNYTVSGSTKFSYVNNKKKWEIVNTVNFTYKNILNCNNNELEKLIDKINDNNYDNLVMFSNNYLNDCILLEGNLKEEDFYNKISKSIVKTSLKMINDNISYDNKKLVENNLDVTCGEYKNILIPIYLISVNYKGNNYFYLMNGFSGKSIINLTYGKSELFIFSFILFSIIFLLGFCIAYLF